MANGSAAPASLASFAPPSCPFQSGPGGCTRRRRRRFASRFSHFRNGLFKAIFPGRPVELPLKSKSKSYNHFKHSQTVGGREGGGEWRAMPDNIIRHMQTERTTKVALMMSCFPPPPLPLPPWLALDNQTMAAKSRRKQNSYKNTHTHTHTHILRGKNNQSKAKQSKHSTRDAKTVAQCKANQQKQGRPKQEKK